MKSKSNGSRFARHLLKFDIFGEKPELQVNGSNHFPTWNGLLISLIIIIVTLRYGHEKFNEMINHDGTNYKKVTESNALDMDTVFESSDFDARLAFNVYRSH